MPVDPIDHDGNPQHSFLVECRSISGYSGSPVFVHIQSDRSRPGAIVDDGQWRHFLLGVDCGHLPHKAKIIDKATRKPVNPDWFASYNSGLMVVVPSWSIPQFFADPILERRMSTGERVLLQGGATSLYTGTGCWAPPDRF